MNRKGIYGRLHCAKKTGKILNKGEDVVFLPGAWIERVTERVDIILWHSQGGSILVHVGTNNTGREQLG